MKKILIFTIWLTFLCGLSGNSIAAEQQTIVFAITPNYMPYNYVDSLGYAHGFDVSFVQLLCVQMNAVCKFKPMKFEDLFGAVKDHQVDAAVAAITITTERKTDFAFTFPYLINTASFIAIKKPDVPQLNQITNEILQGKTVGVQTRSIHPLFILAIFPPVKLKSYTNSEELVAALINNEVDFIVMDTPATRYWVNQAVGNLYVVGTPFNLNLSMGIMVNKDNPKLLAQLNQAILIVANSTQFLDLFYTFFQGYNNTNID